MLAVPIEQAEPAVTIHNEAADMPIENLDLTVRVFNSLKRTGITTVGDVLDLLDKGEEAILSIRNFGEKSLTEKGFLDDNEEDEETTES